MKTLVQKRRHRLTNAFSLVELMIGVALFGLVIGGVYSALVAQNAIVRLNTDNVCATQILTEKMELLRLFSWSQITNSAFLPATFSGPFNSGVHSSSSGITYQGTVTVATPSMTEAYVSNFVLVTVQIAWTNANVLRSRSASTLVSQYGLQNSIY